MKNNIIFKYSLPFLKLIVYNKNVLNLPPNHNQQLFNIIFLFNLIIFLI